MTSIEVGEVLEVDSSNVSGGIGCALDIGGSLCKGVFISNNNKETGKCQVNLVTFTKNDLQDGLNYIKERVSHPDQTCGTIHTTGVAVRKEIKSTIETTFHAKVENLDESVCCVKGAEYLMRHCPRSKTLLPVDEEGVKAAMDMLAGMQKLAAHFGNASNEPCEDVNKLGSGEDSSHLPLHQDIKYPYMIISAGTGCFFAVVSEDGTHKVVDGTTRSGKFFMGLAQLLIGTGNYDEILALAEKGDDSQICNYMRDLKSNEDEEDGYSYFPDDMLIFCFGKVLDDKKKLESYRREDLASALVSMIAMELTQLCAWVAKANNCKHLFMTGGLLKHRLIRNRMLTAFLPVLQMTGNDVRLHYLQQYSHLIALGALLENAEQASRESFKES